MNRNDVIEKNVARLKSQYRLLNQIASTRGQIRPAAIWSRFIKAKRQALILASRDAGSMARKNAPWIVLGGIVSVLVALRAPLINRSTQRVQPGIKTTEDQ